MGKWIPPDGFWERRQIPIPLEEFRFHSTRKWRFDFAWPSVKVALEVEGGIWIRGGHVRGGGFLEDAEKLNSAQRLGWSVYKFTPRQMDENDVAAFLKEVLKEAQNDKQDG